MDGETIWERDIDPMAGVTDEELGVAAELWEVAEAASLAGEARG